MLVLALKHTEGHCVKNVLVKLKQGWQEATVIALGGVPKYRTKGLVSISSTALAKDCWLFLARVSSKIFVYAPKWIENSSEPGMSQSWQYLI